MNGVNSLSVGLALWNSLTCQISECVKMSRNVTGRIVPEGCRNRLESSYRFRHFVAGEKGCRDKAVTDQQTVQSLKGNEIKS